MKDYKEMDKLIFEFGDDIKHFAQNHGGTMPPAIKTQLQDLMFTSFAKEIDAITAREELEIKYKKKFYNKLLHAKLKLAKRDRADAWFDKVFQKYFNRGILEHLLVYGIKFLHDKDLFVPKRLFTQINNDELLGQFTVCACDYLGLVIANEDNEDLPPDEAQSINAEQEQEETTDEAEKSTESEEIEPQPQEETSEQEDPPKSETTEEVADDEVEAEIVAPTGEKKTSYWDGRRKRQK